MIKEYKSDLILLWLYEGVLINVFATPFTMQIKQNSKNWFVFLQVFLGDYSSETNEDDDSLKCMGYCPQINPLWPDTTLQEHFEIYGAVKGMSASDMKEVISR